MEPPYTDPYVRWCERTGSELIATFLLDMDKRASRGIFLFPDVLDLGKYRFLMLNFWDWLPTVYRIIYRSFCLIGFLLLIELQLFICFSQVLETCLLNVKILFSGSKIKQLFDFFLGMDYFCLSQKRCLNVYLDKALNKGDLWGKNNCKWLNFGVVNVVGLHFVFSSVFWFLQIRQ